MSQDIIYFGNFKSDFDLVKNFTDVQSNEYFNKYFDTPIHYGVSKEEAEKTTSSSISWPVEVAIVSNNNEAVNFVQCAHCSLFLDIIRKANEEIDNFEVLIRKPAFSYNEKYKGFVILGVDFISHTQGPDNIVSFASDNKHFFEKCGMNPEFVYRFGHNGKSLYFDNIINRNHELLNEVLIQKEFFSSIPEDKKEVEKFRSAYLNGFQCGFKGSRTFNSKIYTSIFSGENVTAFMVGGIIANTIKSALNKHIPYGVPNLNFECKEAWATISNYISTLAIVDGPEMSSKMKNVQIVHLAMVGSQQNDITAEKVSKAFSEITMCNANLNNSVIKNDFEFAQSLFSKRGSVISSKKAVKNASNIKIKDIENVEIDNSISLSKAQVRSISEMSEGIISIRLQLYDFEIKSEMKTPEGKTSLLSEFKKGNQEVDLHLLYEDVKDYYEDIDELYKKFTTLKHTESSQAGTEKKYIPLTFSSDGLLSKEDGSMIVPFEKVKNHYLKKQNSFSTIFNCVSELD